jgi:hypothetical protein
MGVRSTPELTTDFPVTPSATLQQSIYKFDNLIRAGFLGDYGDVESILPWFGAALVDIEESFAINAPTYTSRTTRFPMASATQARRTANT